MSDWAQYTQTLDLSASTTRGVDDIHPLSCAVCGLQRLSTSRPAPGGRRPPPALQGPAPRPGGQGLPEPLSATERTRPAWTVGHRTL